MFQVAKDLGPVNNFTLMLCLVEFKAIQTGMETCSCCLYFNPT